MSGRKVGVPELLPRLLRSKQQPHNCTHKDCNTPLHSPTLPEPSERPSMNFNQTKRHDASLSLSLPLSLSLSLSLSPSPSLSLSPSLSPPLTYRKSLNAPTIATRTAGEVTSGA